MSLKTWEVFGKMESPPEEEIVEVIKHPDHVERMLTDIIEKIGKWIHILIMICKLARKIEFGSLSKTYDNPIKITEIIFYGTRA